MGVGRTCQGPGPEHPTVGTRRQANLQEASSGRPSPEEKAKRAHVAQVHAEHAADLLQGAHPLRLIPARGLQEAVVVREAQVGIGAGGGAGGAGEVSQPRRRAERAWGAEPFHPCAMPGLNTHTTDTPKHARMPRLSRCPRVNESVYPSCYRSGPAIFSCGWESIFLIK